MTTFRKVCALSGGVGGARFVHGLARALPPEVLTTIVNTGDDFEHWGLWVSPDVDTVMYTLADLAHVDRGWGLAEESFHALSRMKQYGGDDWFALGDRDLATHVFRTERLRRGERLCAITASMCRGLGISSRVIPMADAPCRTMIDTVDQGSLPFQEWFVRRRAEPAVRGVRYEGAPAPAEGVLEALAEADVIVLGPSNPYVSIDPILSLPGVREALGARRGRPVIAVSPIVGGKAVKGPLASMLREIDGAEPGPSAIARHYGFVTGMVVETGDEAGLEGVRVLATRTVMKTREGSLGLAREVLAFAGEGS